MRRPIPRRRLFILALLAVHASLLAWGAWRHSPTVDEIAHLPAGISHWHIGRFDLYRVNPPLVRMIAALPVMGAGAKTDWGDYVEHSTSRSEFQVGEKFCTINGQRTFWLFTIARWACIPFSLIGAIVCYAWARQLYGPWPGMLALVLWCFCPTILGHAQLITPDAPAAAMGILAAYTFWRWLNKPTWGAALWAGVALGLCELTKSTWIVLFGLWPVLWIVWRIGDWWSSRVGNRKSEVRKAARGTSDEDGEQRAGSVSDGLISETRSVSEGNRRQSGKRKAKSGGTRIGVEVAQLALLLAIAVYAINVGYGFESTFQRLGDIPFISRALGDPEVAMPPPEGPNRFRGTWMGRIRVPLPANYVRGIDVQRWDFERKKWSYLRGEWREGGWWYYYLYALVVKVPLGIWGLCGLSLVLGLMRRDYGAAWRDELCLLAPLIVVLVLVSSQTGFSHHVRYVLPVFGVAFVWMSKVGRAIAHLAPLRDGGGTEGTPQRGFDRVLAGLVVMCVAATVASCLWVYPHSLSYFNELVGGPRYGYKHLDNSNIDWDQDLLYLKRWYDRHPRARPMAVRTYFNQVNPKLAGIEAIEVPVDPTGRGARESGLESVGPLPGWYAVSVNKLIDYNRDYAYFLELEPVGRAGYSIYIYHLTLDEANRLRRQYGLRELPAP